MKLSDVLSWYEELATRRVPEAGKNGLNQKIYEPTAAIAWIAEAETALARVFPAGDPVLVRFKAVLSGGKGDKTYLLYQAGNFENARAAFGVAHSMLKAGRLSSFVEGIRAETVSDMLDQADYLADQKFVVPATVVAGGALETFLHFTCTRNDLTWQGHGSITAYASVLGTARKAGNEVISLADEKQVTAWGDLRNGAAHKPAEFDRSVDSVKLMIEGIRQFIGRNTR